MKKCWCGNERFSEYSKQYWRCDACQSLVSKVDISYDAEHIQDEGDFYGKDYWEKKMLAATQLHSLSEVVDLYLKERAVYWLKSLYQYVLPGKGRIAEVGCGLGQFSYLLKMSGFEQYAYELSPHICAYVTDTLKINCICGGFREDSAAYDAVTAFDVLEHLVDPRSFLRAVSNSLKETGIALMQTPCYDDSLSCQQMLREKPRFEEQLKANEHAYLFSRRSVRKLLSEHGLSHVVFLDAFFGNDYDMFFAASKSPIHLNSPEEIDGSLNRQENGRIIKALIHLWTNSRDAERKAAALEEQGNSHIWQIKKLTEQLQISEADRAQRLEQIDRLSEQLRVSEEDRAQRLKQINLLTEQLRVSEEDRAQRLEQINLLTEQLRVSEVDRAARLEKILQLTDMLTEK